MLSPGALRRDRVLHRCPALILPTLVPVGRHQRRRLRVQGLRPGLVGDGRRPRRLRPRRASPSRACYAFDKCWDNGYRQITIGTKPINTPDDLKGFKIRVPVSPLWISMFKALRRLAHGINFSEVYSALQTKIVDGQENPLADHPHRQALRGAEILLADQPHVGRHSGSWPTAAWDGAAGRLQDDRREATSTRRR